MSAGTLTLTVWVASKTLLGAADENAALVVFALESPPLEQETAKNINAVMQKDFATVIHASRLLT